MDLDLRSIKALREALDTKKVSVKELAQLYLDRIDTLDHTIESYVTVTKETALASAEKAQAIIDKGEATALTGIPIAVKDNVCTNGIRTTCSSRMLENFVPPYDATIIENLNKDNYVLLGKTTMDEFAMGNSNQTSAFQKAKNPYDIDRVSGGSSGGSAAAVSSALAAAAIGTDTGGSIRQPSAFCGVTGIKPTYGAVSRYGIVPFASSLDQAGAIANNAYDCGLILNSISSHDKRDATSANRNYTDYNAKIGQSIKGMKIALPKEFFEGSIADEVKQSVLNAAKDFEKQGAILVDASIPDLRYAVSAYYLISSAEAASNLSRYDGIKYGLRGQGRTYEEMLRDCRTKGFGEEVKRRILLGNYALSSGYYDDYYIKALALKQEIIREYNDVFANADVILTPTVPVTAMKIGETIENPVQMYLADIYTVTVNIASLPAISTTCGYDKDGMPIGMSLVGKKFDEQTLIQLADNFENRFETILPKIQL